MAVETRNVSRIGFFYGMSFVYNMKESQRSINKKYDNARIKS